MELLTEVSDATVDENLGVPADGERLCRLFGAVLVAAIGDLGHERILSSK